MSGAGSGIAGTVGGSFFRPPGWVDLKKEPGTTPQKPASWDGLVAGWLRMRHLVFSPNLVWLLFSIVIYVAFPYDFEAAKVAKRKRFASLRPIHPGGPTTPDCACIRRLMLLSRRKQQWHPSWIMERVAVNFGAMGIYYGFWHVTLYGLSWGSRKFKPDNMPSAGTMLHNVWYVATPRLHLIAHRCV